MEKKYINYRVIKNLKKGAFFSKAEFVFLL